MSKVIETFCDKCQKKYKSKDLIEITTDPTCPDCGEGSLKNWKKKSITCDNEPCYTSERVLLVREDVYKAQKKASALSAKISKEKDANKRTSLMASQREVLGVIKDKLLPDPDESLENFMARQDKTKYVCSDCGKVLTLGNWKDKKYICPKCKEPQMVKVRRDKTVFAPREAKHTTVVCPKYHVIARTRRE